jgi:hypothetical protein
MSVCVPCFSLEPVIHHRRIADTPLEFTIAGWPTVYDEARQALDGMEKTHRVNFLPAYDTENKILSPTAYRTDLCGAWVKLEFTMKHWAFAAKAGAADGSGATTAYDMFTADIHKIFVLVPPFFEEEDKDVSVKEGKRKFEQFDAMQPSPKKHKKLTA